MHFFWGNQYLGFPCWMQWEMRSCYNSFSIMLVSLLSSKKKEEWRRRYTVSMRLLPKVFGSFQRNVVGNGFSYEMCDFRFQTVWNPKTQNQQQQYCFILLSFTFEFQIELCLHTVESTDKKCQKIGTSNSTIGLNFFVSIPILQMCSPNKPWIIPKL